LRSTLTPSPDEEGWGVENKMNAFSFSHYEEQENTCAGIYALKKGIEIN